MTTAFEATNLNPQELVFKANYDPETDPEGVTSAYQRAKFEIGGGVLHAIIYMGVDIDPWSEIELPIDPSKTYTLTITEETP